MAAIDEDLMRCIQIDTAFVEGVKLGWQLATDGNSEHYCRIVRAREDAIIEARKELGTLKRTAAYTRTAVLRP